MNGTLMRRFGFTLVELLAVLGLIALLVGLVMPAIQHAREAANRTRCANNLKQIGLAIQHHNDAARELPHLGYYDPDDRVWTPYSFPTDFMLRWGPRRAFRRLYATPFELAGWAYQLFPYLELKGSPGLRDSNVQSILRLPANVFHCPSRSGPRVHVLPRNPFTQDHPIYTSPEIWRVVFKYPKDRPIPVAQTDYAANGGVGVADLHGPFNYSHAKFYAPPGYTDPKFDGPPGYTPRPFRSRSFDDLSDGLTHTVLIGEKLINRAQIREPQPGDTFGYASNYNDGHIRFCGGPAPGTFLTPQPDFWGPAGLDAGGRFGSSHAGGALFAFADGGVRPVSYNVDGRVFFALCMRSDGRSINEADYE